MGAVCGDVAGSIYEWNNIKYKPDKEQLIHPRAKFTDDTVMTCAVADGIRIGLSQLPHNWMDIPEAENMLYSSIQNSLLHYGRKYPNAGYGGAFRRWLASSNPRPYNSWGNGSAMRASYAGWAALSLDEAEKLGEISAKVTHNHPEGIRGAEAVAMGVYLARIGKSKEEIREKLQEYYPKLKDKYFTIENIHGSYGYDDYGDWVTCQGSIPQALIAFLDSTSFEDAIRNAVCIGGDSDTIGAMTGSIAEAYYGISYEMEDKALEYLTDDLKSLYFAFGTIKKKREMRK